MVGAPGNKPSSKGEIYKSPHLQNKIAFVTLNKSKSQDFWELWLRNPGGRPNMYENIHLVICIYLFIFKYKSRYYTLIHTHPKQMKEKFIWV